jgi:hypothetical protein
MGIRPKCLVFAHADLYWAIEQAPVYHGTMDDESPWVRVASLLAESIEGGKTTKFARTDALRPLTYPMAASLAGLPVLALVKAPEWASFADIGVLALCILSYLSVYLFLLLSRPDALRSETFELTKYAIEKHYYGDSTTGRHMLTDEREPRSPVSKTGASTDDAR